jgi:hypothetical protein
MNCPFAGYVTDDSWLRILLPFLFVRSVNFFSPFRRPISHSQMPLSMSLIITRHTSNSGMFLQLEFSFCDKSRTYLRCNIPINFTLLFQILPAINELKWNSYPCDTLANCRPYDFAPNRYSILPCLTSCPLCIVFVTSVHFLLHKTIWTSQPLFFSARLHQLQHQLWQQVHPNPHRRRQQVHPNPHHLRQQPQQHLQR